MNEKNLTHEEMLEIAEKRMKANRDMEDEVVLDEPEITENNGTLQD